MSTLNYSSKTYWTAMFSRTGYELAEIIKRLGIVPNNIICNKNVLASITCPELLKIIDANKIKFHRITKAPAAGDYNKIFKNNTNQIITLHGWMRIVPPAICDKYEIYNGHPGLITKYPELKGKDPQIRAFNGGYPEIGTVIHKVVAEVDSGEVLATASLPNSYDSADGIFDVLREMSITLWCDILMDKLKN